MCLLDVYRGGQEQKREQEKTRKTPSSPSHTCYEIQSPWRYLRVPDPAALWTSQSTDLIASVEEADT